MIIKIRTKNSKTKEKVIELNDENNNEKGTQDAKIITTLNYPFTNQITEIKKKNDKKRTIYNIIFLIILIS